MTIERKFIQQHLKELQIKEHIFEVLGKVGVARVKLQRTPLGEKILISCSRPGLVVGRAGSNIQKLTQNLKSRFGLENPQIEIEELTNPMLEASILAEMISNSMERFGIGRFKGIGHKAMNEAMNAGALGVEILISGKVPSQRAKTWRFYNGYLKKCGDVAIEGVDIVYRVALLKSGIVGIKVSVMPPTTILPDRIEINAVDDKAIFVEEVVGTPDDVEAKIEEAKEKRRAPRKKKEDTDGAKAADSDRSKRAPRKRKEDEDAKTAETAPENAPSAAPEPAAPEPAAPEPAAPAAEEKIE
jgi:small subunit ribosomal protein S3